MNCDPIEAYNLIRFNSNRSFIYLFIFIWILNRSLFTGWCCNFFCFFSFFFNILGHLWKTTSFRWQVPATKQSKNLYPKRYYPKKSFISCNWEFSASHYGTHMRINTKGPARSCCAQQHCLDRFFAGWDWISRDKEGERWLVSSNTHPISNHSVSKEANLGPPHLSKPTWATRWAVAGNTKDSFIPIFSLIANRHHQAAAGEGCQLIDFWSFIQTYGDVCNVGFRRRTPVIHFEITIPDWWVSR